MKDKKQAIFDSALELINENGFHGTSMGQLAKHANVAAGTIYHYFKGKEEMICALYTNNLDRLFAVILEANDLEKTYKERFYAIWWAFYDFHIVNPRILRFYEQFVNSPYYDEHKGVEITNFYHSFFEEGIAAGVISKNRPEVLTSLMLGNGVSALKMKFYKNINLSREEINGIIDMLWKGLSA